MSSFATVRWIAISLAVAAACPAQEAAESPAQPLISGVAEIAAPGIPGPLAVFGPDAFAVVVGQVGRHPAPVVAAATYGSGGVVAFGHTGFADGPDVGQTELLIRQSVQWASGKPAAAPRALRVGALGENWARSLARLGFNVRQLRGEWCTKLSELDLLCLDQTARTDAEVEAIQRFVERGGGLVAAGLGWGWLQLNEGKSLAEHPLNRICGAMGLLWCDGTLQRTRPDGFDAGRPPSPLVNATAALDAIRDHESGARALAADELELAGETLTRAVRTLPPEDRLLRRLVSTLLANRTAELTPTERKPFRTVDALLRTLLALQVAEMGSLPPERVGAHPASAEFPGAVPRDAHDLTRELRISCTQPDWHSTGLYAAPGRAITVDVEPAAATAGLGVRIGAHRDLLWDSDKWARVPEITGEWPLRDTRTVVASAFGGPIYIVAPRDCSIAEASVVIHGGFEMPHYVHGRTTDEEWRRRRGAPAPWAELESSKIILTVPARVVRDLDNPRELMRFWDELADAHGTLATIPTERERPERFVADVQISAGYMHSGYPIMTHLDASELFVDLHRLRTGQAWGFFHELGHNHQSDDWTFDGAGEVTCNLFALHAIDTVCQPEPGDRGHEAVNRPPSVAQYIADGASFATWKREPFLALQMYIQLQREFGWEPFKRVFAEYRALPPDQRPRSDDEKRDQWMVRMSRTVGKDLGPFFTIWGVPTSAAARDAIRDLPEWMPEELRRE